MYKQVIQNNHYFPSATCQVAMQYAETIISNFIVPRSTGIKPEVSVTRLSYYVVEALKLFMYQGRQGFSPACLDCERVIQLKNVEADGLGEKPSRTDMYFKCGCYFLFCDTLLNSKEEAVFQYLMSKCSIDLLFTKREYTHLAFKYQNVRDNPDSRRAHCILFLRRFVSFALSRPIIPQGMKYTLSKEEVNGYRCIEIHFPKGFDDNYAWNWPDDERISVHVGHLVRQALKPETLYGPNGHHTFTFDKLK